MIPSILVCLTLAPQLAVRAPIEPTVRPFALTDVRLLPGPCLDAQERDKEYLLWLDPDRLLRPFRVNAGLPAPGEPYTAWEAADCEIRGHFVGHYLTALALMHQSTGDAEVKERLDLMVAEFARCQEALGGGYLSAFPATYWDRLEAMEKPPWAPFYVIHKIMAGALDAYVLTGNEQGLAIAEGMAEWLARRFDPIPEEQWQRMLTVEFGGMSDVLHNLYEVTANPEHLRLANRFNQERFLEPLWSSHDNLTGLHGNTHIPKVIAAVRHYELTGDERYLKAAWYFWKRVVLYRTFASGGTTAFEVWGPPGEMAGTENQNPHETCKTHNMLKLTRLLFELSPTAQYGDYYERAFLNGILGTQHPKTGQLIYYVYQGAGSRKQWGTPDGAFWCCYGTGIESFAKLADSVYFHSDDELYVNLFLPTRLAWHEKGVTLEQTTGFPEEQGTTLTVGCQRPTRFTLKLRIPEWVARRATVRVNGQVVAEGPVPGYLPITRTFRNGDRVELSLPMSCTSIALPGDPDSIALRYGPLVLAAVGMPEATPAASKHPHGAEGSYIPMGAGDPASQLEPVPGEPLTFRLRGAPAGVKLIPLNRVTDETYQVYLPLVREGSEKQRELAAQGQAERDLAARVVDEVVPMEPDEVSAHGLEGENTQAGPYNSWTWRHAPDPGWWSWDLKVLPDKPMSLLVTFWGSDVPPRTFDVQVEGQTLATVSLDRNAPGMLFDREFAIPAELTRGKSKVAVRFVPAKGNIAGGAFYCATLR